MPRRVTLALLAALLCLLPAGRALAESESLAMTPSQLVALQRALGADRAVHAALGSTLDILRVQPAALQPGRFVVDLGL